MFSSDIWRILRTFVPTFEINSGIIEIRMIEIREATKSQAAEIANLIMMAMTDDCCLYFCDQYVNDNQWGGHPMKHLVL